MKLFKRISAILEGTWKLVASETWPAKLLKSSANLSEVFGVKSTSFSWSSSLIECAWVSTFVKTGLLA